MSKFSPTAQPLKQEIVIFQLYDLILWVCENAELSICDILNIISYNNQLLSRQPNMANLSKKLFCRQI